MRGGNLSVIVDVMKQAWCTAANNSILSMQRRVPASKLKIDLIEEEDMSFVRRHVRSERWYAMRSSKLELEADLVEGGIVEEGIWCVEETDSLRCGVQ